MVTQAYPIVYVRGYAMTQAEVEETFNMPYYGFNLGSTQVKQARDERADMSVFESPVIRLIKEQGYCDSFRRFVTTRNVPIKDRVAQQGVDWRKTLWIFRFYDEEAELFGADRPADDIETYARKLWLFLHQVREGWISREHAGESYGVVLCGPDGDLQIDVEATEALRAELEATA